VEGGDAPWQLTFHVLSSARFSLRSVRRLIFAERITPSCSTSRLLAASAWSRTVSLKQQGGKDEDRRCNGFDNEAKPGLQHNDLKPPTDASVDVTDAREFSLSNRFGRWTRKLNSSTPPIVDSNHR